MHGKKRIIVGISGASGFIYGIRALEILRKHFIETHLVVSASALLTGKYELDVTTADLIKMSDYMYGVDELDARISSGSFKTDGMIVAPCSVNTLSCVAHGITGNLLTRAADVTLKERRKLVLLLRETPLHTGHLKSMLTVSEMGAVIYPPVPAFYNKPSTVDEIVTFTLSRALELFDIDINFPRWGDKG